NGEETVPGARRGGKPSGRGAAPASSTGRWRACCGSKGRWPSRRGRSPTPGRREFGNTRTSTAVMVAEYRGARQPSTAAAAFVAGTRSAEYHALASDLSLDSMSGDFERNDRRDAMTTPAPLSRWGSLEIREKLGEGSYGEGFRAGHPQLQIQVALKLFKPTVGAAVSRALGEARALARVRHE